MCLSALAVGLTRMHPICAYSRLLCVLLKISAKFVPISEIGCNSRFVHTRTRHNHHWFRHLSNRVELSILRDVGVEIESKAAAHAGEKPLRKQI